MSSEITGNKRKIENDERNNLLEKNENGEIEKTLNEKYEKGIKLQKTIKDYFNSPKKIKEETNNIIYESNNVLNEKNCNDCYESITSVKPSPCMYIEEKKEKEEKEEKEIIDKKNDINENDNISCISTASVCSNSTSVPSELKGKVHTIMTWNVNSITVRYKNTVKWKEFIKFFYELNPDVVCLQEVRLPAMAPANTKNKSDVPRIRNIVKSTDPQSYADFLIVEKILNTDFANYNHYFSLANIKYSGQLMLIKKNIEVKSIRFNLSFDTDPNIHNPEGRIILAEFSKFFILTTYTPNNGFEMPKFERRRQFDEQLENFVRTIKNEKNKFLIWTGDLNIAPEDIDLSHPIEFRRMKKGNVPKEHIGQPGCTDFERKNFQRILNAGNLVDTYRYFDNLQRKKENEKNMNRRRDINENIYTWRCAFNLGKQNNKAMRIDHYIVSQEFLKYVDKVHIQGYGVDHTNFYGSDHCPVILYLKKEEEVLNKE